MKPIITLACYKGDGMILDWLIRKVTSSPHSHCELIVDGKSYSSRIEDSGVKSKYRYYIESDWDYVHIDPDKINLEKMQKVFDEGEGAGYDYLGVFRFIIPFIPQSKTRYFCSEFDAEALGIENPFTYHPGSLFDYCKKNLSV